MPGPSPSSTPSSLSHTPFPFLLIPSKISYPLATITRTRGDSSRALQLLEQALSAAPPVWTPRPRAEKLLEEWKR